MTYRWVAAGVAVAFLGYLFLYPLARILGLSLGEEGAFGAFGKC